MNDTRLTLTSILLNDSIQPANCNIQADIFKHCINGELEAITA